MHAPTPYSAVFLLHAPVPALIKIGFGAVRCSSCGCVGEAYTPSSRQVNNFPQRFKFFRSLQKKVLGTFSFVNFLIYSLLSVRYFHCFDICLSFLDPPLTENAYLIRPNYVNIYIIPSRFWISS
jgi:hypothetical protein